MKKFLSALIVAGIFLLTTIAHAEVKTYTGEEMLIAQLTDRQESFREAITPRMSPKEIITAQEKISETEKAKGFFGYGQAADFAIAVLILVGVVAIIFFLKPTFRSFGKSSDLARIIQKYNGDYMNPQIVPEIYLYCCNNELLNPVVRKHSATVNDFAVIYIWLISSCNVSGKGHFIPISAFFFATSLDYVLSRKNVWHREDSLWLIKYFGLIS